MVRAARGRPPTPGPSGAGRSRWSRSARAAARRPLGLQVRPVQAVVEVEQRRPPRGGCGARSGSGTASAANVSPRRQVRQPLDQPLGDGRIGSRCCAAPSTQASAYTASRCSANDRWSPSSAATNCHSGRVSRSTRCASSSHSIAASRRHAEAAGQHDVQDGEPGLDLGRRAQLDRVARLPDQRELAGGSGQPEPAQLARQAWRTAGPPAGSPRRSDGRLRRRSRWATSGPNAGRQIATYSAPSSAGVVYRTRSPARVSTAWPARTSTTPGRRARPDTAPRRTSVTSSNSGRLGRLGPAAGATMCATETAAVAGVHPSDVLVDDLAAGHRDAGRASRSAQPSGDPLAGPADRVGPARRRAIVRPRRRPPSAPPGSGRRRRHAARTARRRPDRVARLAVQHDPGGRR